MRTPLLLCVGVEGESDLCGTYPSAHGEGSGLQIRWRQVDWEYYVDYSMWLDYIIWLHSYSPGGQVG